jgi:hypothetical protein
MCSKQTVFPLIVHHTYHQSGFFNVRVTYDDLVRATEGTVELLLEPEGRVIEAHVNRSAQRNGTARIMGGVALRDWFRAHCAPGDAVHVDLSSKSQIKISKPTKR